ncbi:MAG: SIMPL domain-containing protein [Candidatus Micrarchaeales archaeon]
MIWPIVAAIVVAGFIIGLGIYYSTSGSTGPNASLITITATGTASTTGGQAVFYLYVNGSGTSAKTAIANLSNTLNNLNNTLAPYINNNFSLISTQYFSANKIYNSTLYSASESITVTIPNAKNATGVLVGLSGIPNVYINNVQATLTDQQTTALRNQALSDAIANATAQAQSVSPTGMASVTNITVNNFYIYPFPYAFNGGMAGGPAMPVAAVSSQQINSLFYSGKNSVTESITAIFKAS